MIILNHHCVVILLAKILLWARFLQSMRIFSFYINPWQFLLKKYGAYISHELIVQLIPT